jgi:hypothetical protein
VLSEVFTILLKKQTLKNLLSTDGLLSLEKLAPHLSNLSSEQLDALKCKYFELRKAKPHLLLNSAKLLTDLEASKPDADDEAYDEDFEEDKRATLA